MSQHNNTEKFNDIYFFCDEDKQKKKNKKKKLKYLQPLK